MLEISTSPGGVPTLHFNDSGKKVRVLSRALVVLNFDFRQAHIIDGVAHHDSVTQSGPVGIVLTRTAGHGQLQLVMLWVRGLRRFTTGEVPHRRSGVRRKRRA